MIVKIAKRLRVSSYVTFLAHEMECKIIFLMGYYIFMYMTFIMFFYYSIITWLIYIISGVKKIIYPDRTSVR